MKLYAKRNNLLISLSTGISIAIAAPFLGEFLLDLLITICIYAIFTVSLDLLVGFTGLVSLGHAIGWGVAAYTVAILNHHSFAPDFFMLIVASMFMVLVLTGLIGLVVTRLTKIYFVMITFAFGQMLYSVAFSWTKVTGGSDGLSDIARPRLALLISLDNDLNFFYLVLTCLAVTYFILKFVTVSPFGRTLIGIRENEHRLRALGYNTLAYKWFSFIISGLFAGLGGILFAIYFGFVGPSELNWGWSGEGLLMLLIGGQGSLWGALIGTVLYCLMKSFIGAYTEHWPLVIGIIFVLIVRFFKGGIGHLIMRWINEFGRQNIKD
ncbi:MAG: branched-chain amino acid ABC transporter permease [Thermodesulfobacteriota bacterium]|nr:branched-chain amino acid ABC transporter permease [Thermodesulfobacteriota bacterium]